MSKFGIGCIIIAIIMVGSVKYVEAQSISQDPLYKLVFQDEFDSIGLSTSKWSTQYRWGYNMFNANQVGLITGDSLCYGSGFPGNNVDIGYNSQAPFDTSRAFDTIGTGYQRMKFYKTNFNAPLIKYVTPCSNCDSNFPCFNSFCGSDSIVPFKYSGAMLRSRYKFKYAYIEMKYRLPNISASPFNAYAPNLWMFNSNPSDSANYSELDIFEQRGVDWKMAPNLHYQNQITNPFWNAEGNPVSTYSPYPVHMYPSVSGGYNGGTWHIVGCEWTPDYTDFYYDSNDTIRRYSVTKFPVNKLTSMPLIIDCTIPATNYCIPFHTTSPVTQMPFNYDIDYVKVYQINQVANCSTTSGNFPSLTTNVYTSQLYRDLTIGGTGTSILNSGSFHLAGQNFVLLQSGFEASGTATVIVSTTPCQIGQSVSANSNDPDQSAYPNIINNLRIAKHYNGDE